MLAFNHLGNLGRLGNQMFEYAALRGIAAKNNYEWCIPPFSVSGIENYSLHKCFKLESVTEDRRDIKEDFIHLKERYFHYDQELHENCPDNVSLYGFFQSEKYFEEISEDIRKEFVFLDHHLDPCLEFISEFKNQEPIFIHVRRGDPNLVDPRGFKWAYVNCQDQHPLQTLEYYTQSLAKFDNNQPVIIFSDSPEWVMEQKIFKGDRFFISQPQEKYDDGSYTPYTDLCLMSLCSHAIIANSSLSWWGAWLINNPNKKIIAPKKWFGPAYADKDTKDLYCSGWEVFEEDL